jgi:CTP synthase
MAQISRDRFWVSAGDPRFGMRFSGMSPDRLLPEMMEYENHPWFIGVQFYPELKSRPFAPHPLFASFVEAAVEQSRLV